jgi:hypothetical protein
MTPSTRAASPGRLKNKTLAAWMALIGGCFGWHRLYLHGWSDKWALAHAIPTVLGFWGVDRVLAYGQDDKLSWLLLPLLGFSIAAACLTGILYALQTPEAWNRTYNPGADPEASAGQTRWLTIIALVLALMVGSMAFMAGIAFSFQRFFEYQVALGLQMSQ